MMKKFYFLIFSFFLTNFAQSQDAYICVPTGITGFKFNAVSKTWEQKNFRTSNTKKLLKRNEREWNWQVFGSKNDWSECGGLAFGGKDDFNSDGFIFCDVIGGHMRMSKNSLRYVETYELGYVVGTDENSDTPLIEIGTCSPL